MEKKEVLSFPGFHQILRPYTAVTQYVLYNELFYWAYPEGSVPEAYVSRWCTGRDPVKEVISRPAAMEPGEFERYRALWKTLLDSARVHCPDTLVNSLRAAIKKDVFQQNKRLPKAEHELLAWALVQALQNDYISNSIQIDPSLLSAFQDADQLCREANIPLNAPHILDILLSLPRSPLLQALNKLHPNLGSQYAQSMKAYAQSTHHSGTHDGWDVSSSEFLFYAQKKAFLDKRTAAGEADIINGLLLSRSNVVADLLRHAGGREALSAALSSLNQTTVPDILL